LNTRIERTEIDSKGNPIKIRNSSDISVNDIVSNVLKDNKFYDKSGGGITVSGGEPVCQIDELDRLLTQCKKYNLHTAIETALNYDYDNLKRLFPVLDLIIADCKAISSDIHLKCTGVTNEKIIYNIKKMSSENKKIWIRIPVVPDVNIDFEEIEKISMFLRSVEPDKIELIAYHKMGIKKYEKWGMEYKLKYATEPQKEYMNRCYEILAANCKNVNVQGD
jgi:pyruvate formate lyase activating enzyme